MDALRAGADRFAGFADLYDDVRPTPPDDLGEILTAYLGRRADHVVDLGCGTGLSTRWAATWAARVTGVEPSADMRAIAERATPPEATFVEGWSHATGLPDGCADIVIVAQALHWMEPEPTFREVARVLGDDGLFAAIDCDWPPIIGDPAVERAWDTCHHRMHELEGRFADGADRADGVRRWSKGQHLTRMEESGVFTWCREITAVAETTGSAERLRGLLRSQGGYQALQRHGRGDDEIGMAEFDRVVDERLGDRPSTWRFVYRVRLGTTMTLPSGSTSTVTRTR